MWADDTFQQAVASASPDLARQVQTVLAVRSSEVRRVRRAALATARYAIRYAHRPTPYGLFAGVAQVEFADTAEVRVGSEHLAVVRPDPVALDVAISGWEADGDRMADADVCVNNLVQQRGERVYVPSEGASEFSLALSPALKLILDVARSPVRYSLLADKLAAEFPTTTAQQRTGLLGELLRVRLLRSSLRAPATVIDPTDRLPPALRDEVRERTMAPICGWTPRCGSRTRS